MDATIHTPKSDAWPNETASETRQTIFIARRILPKEICDIRFPSAIVNIQEVDSP